MFTGALTKSGYLTNDDLGEAITLKSDFASANAGTGTMAISVEFNGEDAKNYKIVGSEFIVPTVINKRKIFVNTIIAGKEYDSTRTAIVSGVQFTDDKGNVLDSSLAAELVLGEDYTVTSALFASANAGTHNVTGRIALKSGTDAYKNFVLGATTLTGHDRAPATATIDKRTIEAEDITLTGPSVAAAGEEITLTLTLNNQGGLIKTGFPPASAFMWGAGSSNTLYVNGTARQIGTSNVYEATYEVIGSAGEKASMTVSQIGESANFKELTFSKSTAEIDITEAYEYGIDVQLIASKTFGTYGDSITLTTKAVKADDSQSSSPRGKIEVYYGDATDSVPDTLIKTYTSASGGRFTIPRANLQHNEGNANKFYAVFTPTVAPTAQTAGYAQATSQNAEIIIEQRPVTVTAGSYKVFREYDGLPRYHDDYPVGFSSLTTDMPTESGDGTGLINDANKSGAFSVKGLLSGDDVVVKGSATYNGNSIHAFPSSEISTGKTEISAVLFGADNGNYYIVDTDPLLVNYQITKATIYIEQLLSGNVSLDRDYDGTTTVGTISTANFKNSSGEDIELQPKYFYTSSVRFKDANAEDDKQIYGRIYLSKDTAITENYTLASTVIESSAHEKYGNGATATISKINPEFEIYGPSTQQVGKDVTLTIKITNPELAKTGFPKASEIEYLNVDGGLSFTPSAIKQVGTTGVYNLTLELAANSNPGDFLEVSELNVKSSATNYNSLQSGSTETHKVTVSEDSAVNVTLTASKYAGTYGDSIRLTAKALKADSSTAGVPNGVIAIYRYTENQESASASIATINSTSGSVTLTKDDLTAGEHSFVAVFIPTGGDEYSDGNSIPINIDIAERTLKVSAGSYRISKEYDGNDQMPLMAMSTEVSDNGYTGALSVSGKLSTDDVGIVVSVNSQNSFVTSDVSSEIANVGLSLNGDDAVNYNLVTGELNVTAQIVKKVLYVDTITADKAYDGTRTADVRLVTFTGKDGQKVEPVSSESKPYTLGDEIYLTSTLFKDANAGDDKQVTGRIYIRSGNDLYKNYTLASTSLPATATSNIGKVDPDVQVLAPVSQIGDKNITVTVKITNPSGATSGFPTASQVNLTASNTELVSPLKQVGKTGVYTAVYKVGAGPSLAFYSVNISENQNYNEFNSNNLEQTFIKSENDHGHGVNVTLTANKTDIVYGDSVTLTAKVTKADSTSPGTPSGTLNIYRFENAFTTTLIKSVNANSTSITLSRQELTSGDHRYIAHFVSATPSYTSQGFSDGESGDVNINVAQRPVTVSTGSYKISREYLPDNNYFGASNNSKVTGALSVKGLLSGDAISVVVENYGTTTSEEVHSGKVQAKLSLFAEENEMKYNYVLMNDSVDVNYQITKRVIEPIRVVGTKYYDGTNVIEPQEISVRFKSVNDDNVIDSSMFVSYGEINYYTSGTVTKTTNVGLQEVSGRVYIKSGTHMYNNYVLKTSVLPESTEENPATYMVEKISPQIQIFAPTSQMAGKEVPITIKVTNPIGAKSGFPSIDDFEISVENAQSVTDFKQIGTTGEYTAIYRMGEISDGDIKITARLKNPTLNYNAMTNTIERTVTNLGSDKGQGVNVSLTTNKTAITYGDSVTVTAKVTKADPTSPGTPSGTLSIYLADLNGVKIGEPIRVVNSTSTTFSFRPTSNQIHTIYSDPKIMFLAEFDSNSPTGTSIGFADGNNYGSLTTVMVNHKTISVLPGTVKLDVQIFRPLPNVDYFLIDTITVDSGDFAFSGLINGDKITIGNLESQNVIIPASGLKEGSMRLSLKNLEIKDVTSSDGDIIGSGLYQLSGNTVSVNAVMTDESSWG